MNFIEKMGDLEIPFGRGCVVFVIGEVTEGLEVCYKSPCLDLKGWRHVKVESVRKTTLSLSLSFSFFLFLHSLVLCRNGRD